mmetsp:Transcript_35964/g.94312  ORF Transcript_35964/g.94312 Transcript_35964/m.94312 type:complete len:337 (+) Transcript_35964:53-1063(+)
MFKVFLVAMAAAQRPGGGRWGTRPTWGGGGGNNMGPSRPRPTGPRPVWTRPVGTGGRGGCAETCPDNEVCMFQWTDQTCMSARQNRQQLPQNCMKCTERGSMTFPTRSHGQFVRPTGRPAWTRPAHYTHRAEQRSCARWNTRQGSIPGGVHDQDTCMEFCHNLQGANGTWTVATESDPASCCCAFATTHTHIAPVSACCDYTDLLPTDASGNVVTDAQQCSLGSPKYSHCAAAVSQVALICSAKTALASDCDVFAAPDSAAFDDCGVIYDCVTAAYHNLTVANRYFPPFETCCPCLQTIGGQVPGEQWMDDIQCTGLAGGQGDDDDDAAGITTPPM